MTEPDVRPIKPFVMLPADAPPYLAGMSCKACGEVLTGGQSRFACPRCAAREGFDDVRLADTGRLYISTTVHRSFPGIPAPFESAIVVLDGGPTLKGNLRHAKPERVRPDMPVRVVFDDAGRRDRQDNRYVAYFFEPVAAEDRA